MGKVGTRPQVSVVVPFAGTRAEAEEMIAALRELALRPGDQLIVADNTGTVPDAADGHLTIVRAEELRSSYYARNLGAEAVTNEWILFLDADCLPSPTLLDDYFSRPIEADVGAVAGEVHGAEHQHALAARYARSRRHLVQEEILFRPFYRPMAVTANLLVRRSAWEAVGGFYEGIRSGGDADFSWRLQDAGWRIGYRAEATVRHLHRETLRDLARQAMRIGAGWAWAARRHPDYPFPNVLRRLARCVAGVAVWTIAGQFERARFKAVDALWVSAETFGFLLANANPPSGPAPASGTGQRLAVLVDEFPTLTETFVQGEVRALIRAGHHVRVEAASRAARPSRGGGRGLCVSFWEDDGIARKAGALAWLVARNPRGCLRDLSDRPRWRREEEAWPLRSLAPAARRIARGGEHHLHAHFAAGAALNTMRLGRLLGLPYSVTVHAYDVFQRPSNLPEKLEDAAFASSVCRYTVERLQSLVPSAADRIHEIGMGIDGGRFRRRGMQGDGRRLVAVGRLIEKKGFAHLLDAVALLGNSRPIDELEIVGAGPLSDELRERAADLGIEEKVRFAGPLEHDVVRARVEAADLLVMPSVIAPDGDRDSLPVVVEEALALEVPVVASDVGGLPEVVKPAWGRVVPAGDAKALATAIEELLALPAERRAAMGKAGREFILQHRDSDQEAAKLIRLVAASRQPRERHSRARAPCAPR